MLYDLVDRTAVGADVLVDLFEATIRQQHSWTNRQSRIDFDSYQELKVLLQEFRPDVIGISHLNLLPGNFSTRTMEVIRQWGVKVP